MIPLWQRIANLLRARLSPLPPGTPLPGETALAAEFGAARMTLRRALAVLEAEGLIRREAGRGSFVARPGNAEGLLADMREIGGRSAVRLLALGEAPLPVHAAAALELPQSAAALHIRRVRADAAGAFSLVDSFVPLSAARSLPRARIARGTPILELLAARGHVLHRAAQQLGAESAGPEAATALGIALGAALIRLERIARDAKGIAFEYSRSLYRADRFAYAVELDARGRAAGPRWVRLSNLSTPG